MEVEGIHLIVGDLDALGIDVGVDFAAHGQARGRCCGDDELDDGLVKSRKTSILALLVASSRSALGDSSM